MRPYDGVIFDMDGTLVQAGLDFQAIRAALGIPPGEGMLEVIARMDPPRRERSMKYLEAQEMQVAARVQLMDGAAETLAAIRAGGLKTALLTRNAAAAMRLVLDRFGLNFDLAWSRDDGPYKPLPDGVLRACRALGVAPARTICVGDFHYDVTAANAAGAVSVLFAPRPPRPAWAAEAMHVIEALPELLRVLGLCTQE